MKVLYPPFFRGLSGLSIWMISFLVLSATGKEISFTEISEQESSPIAIKVDRSQPYFKIREKTIRSAVDFKLYPVYYLSHPSTNTNSQSPSSNKSFLDNAFRLEYTVLSNTPSRYQHVFIYDDLLRTREIIKTDSRGRTVLSISFGEWGELISIKETIPDQLQLEILFHRTGNMAMKTITEPQREWQYRYRYQGGRLAEIISLYNGSVINTRKLTWNPGREGQEINRVEEYDVTGRKTRYWEIEKDLSLRYGEGKGIVKSFSSHGKLKEETLRLWVEGRIIEEHVFRDTLYHLNRYTYDENGLLEEKTIWDGEGEKIAHHRYHYRLPDRVLELVFLDQLKLNTLETTYYLLGGKILLSQNKIFHLQNLVFSSQEEIQEDGETVARRSYTGGLDSIVFDGPGQIKKLIVEPRTGITLFNRKTTYDDYGRIIEITHAYSDESHGRIRFFYEKPPPPLALLSSNDFFPFTEEHHLHYRVWHYLQRQQMEIEKTKTVTGLSLENRFRLFLQNGTQENPSEEKTLLSQLKFLRASGLRKIIAYDRDGRVNYYYRIQQGAYTPEIRETRFTFYQSPPNTVLKNRRIDVLIENSNTYYVSGYPDPRTAANSSDYSYLTIGGEDEFHNQTPDDIDPAAEKPVETIVIRYTDHTLLLQAQQILYNRLTGLPEKEILIQGAKTQIKKIE